MLKAIIVDDEKYIIELFRNLIEWDELGIVIVGQVTNGKDALDIIIKEKPEIVISDIRMPGIDGLELVKKVKEKDIKTDFILISGHKEFQYAYSAIKYGVEYYMLKPISKRELINNLSSIKNKLKTKEEDSSRIEDIVKQSRKRFLYDLMRNPEIFTTKSEESLLEEYQIPSKYSFYRLCLLKLDFKIDLDDKQKSISIGQVLNAISNEDIEDNFKIISLKMKSQILILFSYNDSKIIEKFTVDFKYIHKNYVDYFYVTASIGPEKTRIKDLDFETVRKLIIYRMDLGYGRVINHKSYEYDKLVFLSDRILIDLQRYIENADIGKIELWFTNNENIFLSEHTNPFDQYKQALICANYIFNGLVRLYKNVKNIQYSLEDFNEEIFSSFTRPILLNLLKKIAITETENFINLKSSRDTRYVRMAKQYVQDHYQENITLNDISKYVYLNPAYFSALFKKQEGINFTDYLINYRIELAKDLLINSNLNVNEIGSRIGYRDAKYFSKLFSKIIGINPSDYKKLYG